jgi:hypothetical protein
MVALAALGSSGLAEPSPRAQELLALFARAHPDDALTSGDLDTLVMNLSLRLHGHEEPKSILTSIAIDFEGSLSNYRGPPVCAKPHTEGTYEPMTF